MSSVARPAVSLAAVPGRRAATIELAKEIERLGFAGIYCASFADGLGLIVSEPEAMTEQPLASVTVTE